MHHLKASSQVLSIGRGIIGSAAEENSRKHVNWTQYSCYLLPASKGIACGYIHKPAAVDVDTKSESTKMNGNAAISQSSNKDVILYALKVSPETLESRIPDDVPCWVSDAYSLFQQCLPTKLKDSDSTTNENGSGSGNNNNLEGIPLSEEQSVKMNLIVELVQ